MEIFGGREGPVVSTFVSESVASAVSAASPTTSAQVEGYKYVASQLEQAVETADTRMVHDVPGRRRRALAVGVVLSMLGAAGAGLLAMVRPNAAWGEHAVVADSSGQLYVQLEGVVHPVRSLASARMIVGRAERVHRVGDGVVGAMRRGRVLGQVGPVGLPSGEGEGAVVQGQWAVCSGRGGELTSVVMRGWEAPVVEGLVWVASESGEWIVGRGADGVVVRARASREGMPPGVVRALGLEGRVPVEVSEAWVRSVPRTVDVAAAVKQVGAGARVVRVEGVAPEFYVLREGAMVRVGPVQAEMLISLGVPVDRMDAVEVRQVPVGKAVQWGVVPAERPVWVELGESDGVCVGPQVGVATIGEGAGFSQGVEVEGEGAGVYVGPGVAVAGDTGVGFVVIGSDGSRFSVPGREDLRVLGFSDPMPVPWDVVRLLPDAGNLASQEDSLG